MDGFPCAAATGREARWTATPTTTPPRTTPRPASTATRRIAGWPLDRVPRRLEEVQPRLTVPGTCRRVAGRGEGDGSLQSSRASLPEHVPQHPACCVHVGPLVYLLAPRLLGSHVLRGPCAAHALGTEQVCEPEVEELHPPVLADEHVRGLQVPVQHATLVRVRKPLRHLLGDAQGLGLGDGAFRDALGEGLAPEQFHDEVRTGVARPHVEERHDAGVVEARHRLGFLLDPVGREVAPGPGQPQRLHRHDPVQLGVERLVDRAEASPPHLAHGSRTGPPGRRAEARSSRRRGRRRRGLEVPGGVGRAGRAHRRSTRPRCRAAPRSPPRRAPQGWSTEASRGPPRVSSGAPSACPKQSL